jgi:phosphate:Na+ symporter
MADVVETAIVAVGRWRIEPELAVPGELASLLDNLHTDAVQTARLAADAYLLQDSELAETALEAKASFKRKADHVRLLLGRQLALGQAESLRAYRLGLDLLEAITRLYTLARRIARHVQETQHPSAQSEAIADLQAGARSEPEWAIQ